MIAEGYPVKPSGTGRQPAAFVYTGLPRMFERAGFTLDEARPKDKQRRYRQTIASIASRK